MSNAVVYVVNHTHWDREWQKTFSEYRTRLIKFMDDLIETLEKDESFESFMLDGQTSLIEDYLFIKPKMVRRLKRLIESKRIIIGPWYVQPDEFIPSGEALLRNLLIGEQISHDYGQKMKVGYLPDSFGQSRFIPEILNQFEIEYAVAMRGFNQFEIKTNEFIWESPSGKRVICSVLWAGYNNGFKLVENIDCARQCIEFNLGQLRQGSYKNNILVLAGSDQATARKHMPKLIERLNKKYQDITIKQGTLEEYFNKVKENEDSLLKLCDDFRKAQKQRAHISIAGTRTDIKQRNYEVQTYMEKILEPLSTMGYTFNDRYEEELLTYSWKRIIENHAHDSICTVCIDEAHRNMITRMDEVKEIYCGLRKARINNLIEKIKFNNKKNMRPIIVFNTNSHETEQYVNAVVDIYSSFTLVNNKGDEVDYTILEERKINLKDFRLWLKENPDDIVTRTKIRFKAKVKGIGFRIYYIKEGIPVKQQKREETIEVTDRGISNKHLELSVNEDGTFNLTNKKLGFYVNNILSLVDQGNGGDSYDYSPPALDEVISSKDFNSEITTYRPNTYEASIKVKKTMLVNETSDQQKRSHKKIPMVIEIICTISALNDYIDIDISVNNTAKNHRLSLLIPGFTNSKHVREGSFGDVITENTVNEKNTIEKGWKEHYYPVYPTQRYVYDNESHLALFNKGIQSYEIIKGADLKVHLLTTTDYMGKENLTHRPGRRSGAMIPTNDSLLLGNRSFKLGLGIFDGKDLVYKMCDEFQNPLFSHYVHKKNQQGYIADEMSFFTSLNSKVVTSALVKNPYGDEVIWRIKNMSLEDLDDIILSYNSNLYKFDYEVNMLDHKVNRRISEEIASDYVGEEYEGSGDIMKTGRLRISNIHPNEVLNLKFSKNF